VCPGVRSSELLCGHERPLSFETTDAYHLGRDVLEVPTWDAIFIAMLSKKLGAGGE
jgi:hypothetical protein